MKFKLFHLYYILFSCWVCSFYSCTSTKVDEVGTQIGSVFLSVMLFVVLISLIFIFLTFFIIRFFVISTKHNKYNLSLSEELKKATISAKYKHILALNYTYFIVFFIPLLCCYFSLFYLNSDLFFVGHASDFDLVINNCTIFLLVFSCFSIGAHFSSYRIIDHTIKHSDSPVINTRVSSLTTPNQLSQKLENSRFFTQYTFEKIDNQFILYPDTSLKTHFILIEYTNVDENYIYLIEGLARIDCPKAISKNNININQLVAYF